MRGKGKRKQTADRDHGDGWGQFGGYMNAKIQKLQDQFSDNRGREQEKDGISSNIFNGVAIFVNGYTDPNADELKRLMLIHGGIFRNYYSRTSVTHVIATNLPNSKIKALKDKKVVGPEWITESIKEEKLLPYQNYVLYSGHSTKQQGLNFKFSDTTSTASTNTSTVSTRSRLSHEACDMPSISSSTVTRSKFSLRGDVSVTSQASKLSSISTRNRPSLRHDSTDTSTKTLTRSEQQLNRHGTSISGAKTFSKTLTRSELQLNQSHSAAESKISTDSSKVTTRSRLSLKRSSSKSDSRTCALTAAATRQNELQKSDIFSPVTRPRQKFIDSVCEENSDSTIDMTKETSLHNITTCTAFGRDTNDNLTLGEVAPILTCDSDNVIDCENNNLRTGELVPILTCDREIIQPDGAMKKSDVKPNYQTSNLGALHFQPSSKNNEPDPNQGEFETENAKSKCDKVKSPELVTLDHDIDSWLVGGDDSDQDVQIDDAAEILPDDSSSSTDSKEAQRTNLPSGIHVPDLLNIRATTTGHTVSDSSSTTTTPTNCHTVSNSSTTIPTNQAPSSKSEISNKRTSLVSASKPRDASNSSRSAKDPNFISEFYANSRLHYLSTWGAECCQYVNKLQSEGSGVFPGREKLKKLVEEKRCVGNARGDDLASTMTSGKSSRTIMHIDMDCFFVSVGLQKRPELKGKPVAVTHSKGKGEQNVSRTRNVDREKERALWMKKKLERRKKGQSSATVTEDDVLDDFDEDDDIEVEFQDHQITSSEKSAKPEKQSANEVYSMSDIASCSYEARKAGVRNGMFVGSALKLCPDLITIPYDFDGYKTASQQLYDTIASYTHDIEAVSCDELFVDCTELLSSTGATTLEFVTLVREEINEITECTASAGLGSNILLARLATRVAKPNGQYHLQASEEQAFISKQTVRDLPGVGWSTSQRLEAMKVKTCADLQTLMMSTLQQEFGPKTGASLYKFCRGQDDRPIKMEKERKSVSAEVNYGIRFKEDNDMTTFIAELSKEVEKRLDAIFVKGRTITLKLKVRSKGAPVETSKFMGHGVVDNFSKSVTLPVATSNPDVIAAECMSLFRALKAPVTELRGIGIQVQRLEPLNKKNEKQGRQNILNFMAAKPKNPSATTTSAPMLSTLSSSSTEANSVNPSVSAVKDVVTIPGPLASTPKASRIDGLIDEERRRKELAASGMPPLPSMSPVMPVASCSRLATPDRRLTASPGCYFPSPSQIDPAVLKELPPEIQAQIASEIKEYKKTKKTTNGGGSQEAGCSHWDRGPSRSESTTPVPDQASRVASSSPIVELPSFSQVDKSCFDALPDDIRAELVGAYAAEKSKAPQKEKTIAFKTAIKTSKEADKIRPKTVQLSWKPGAERSPTKSPKKKSPKKKSPSPKKGSPKFKVPKGRAMSRKKPQAKRLDFTSATNADTSDVEIIEVPKAVKNKETPKEDVNLCGAVHLSEVKVILNEWIRSCDDPEDEDMDRFIHYLQNLAKDKNLEQVDLLLKFLKRALSKINSAGWNRGLKEIHNNIQVCVKDIYGCELRIEA